MKNFQYRPYYCISVMYKLIKFHVVNGIYYTLAYG